MTLVKQLCPGCGAERLSASVCLPRQPVVLNYRFATGAAAAAVERRDIELVQCRQCGLVFNLVFDPAAVPYDSNYENRQCCSPAFLEYLQSLASDFVAGYHLQGKRLLEVGCGKGDFLKLICQHASASGVGYDTSYEGPPFDNRVRFYPHYVSAADIEEPFQAVICRHVIEHVPAIGPFLAELRAIAAAARAEVTLVETPNFEWIVEHRCFWDLFYEHCNYFSQDCLAYLAERAGFAVVRHSLTFGGQYQVLELALSERPLALEPPRIAPQTDLHAFAANLSASRRELEARLLQAGAERGWAIWGAGAKGVALVNQLSIQPPLFVIDSNPAKQGCVIPGSAVPVVSPHDPGILTAPVILVANPQYLEEIKMFLAAQAFRNTLLTTSVHENND